MDVDDTMDVDSGKISLNIMVDKQTGKFLHCEAGSDFVNAIFSYLLLPVGFFAGKVEMRGVSWLYESVVDFNEEYMRTKACKTMLLSPRMDMPSFVICSDLLYVNEGFDYTCFPCNNKNGILLLSMFPRVCDGCGRRMTVIEDISIFYEKLARRMPNIVKEGTRFVITNDLNVTLKPAASSSEGSDAIKKETISHGIKELLDLLGRSFVSKTLMEDIIYSSSPQLVSQVETTESQESAESQTLLTDKLKKFNLRIATSESENRVVYALADADFVNLLFSFLTFPVGSIIKLFGGRSSMGSLDNLYKSVQLLSSNSDDKGVWDGAAKVLLNPRIFRMWGIDNQLLQVEEAKSSSSVDHPKGKRVAKCMNPKFQQVTTNTGGGFVTEGDTYFVSDELTVRPISDVNIITYDKASVDLAKDERNFLVPNDVDTKVVTVVDLAKDERNFLVPNDVDTKVVTVGECEALDILRTALTSENVLSNVFGSKQRNKDDQGNVFNELCNGRKLKKEDERRQ